MFKCFVFVLYGKQHRYNSRVGSVLWRVISQAYPISCTLLGMLPLRSGLLPHVCFATSQGSLLAFTFLHTLTLGNNCIDNLQVRKTFFLSSMFYQAVFQCLPPKSFDAFYNVIILKLPQSCDDVLPHVLFANLRTYHKAVAVA